MKVFLQIIDTRNGISQHGMIEEPVQKGFEIANALGHFGVNINSVTWTYEQGAVKCGIVEGTSKIINVVCVC